jgi:glycosyltransferase involved in cell wall biosynthesis
MLRLLLQKPEPCLTLYREARDKRADRPGINRHGKIPHVLMIGLGPNVRGGITSVIEAYLQSRLWRRYSFSWLHTYDDRGPIRKIVAALRAYLVGPMLISRADIVHVHGVFRKSFVRKLPLILMAKAMRKPVIFHVHAATFEGAFNGPIAPVIRWMFASIDKVIALSPYWAAGIQSRCPRADVVSLPNPVIVKQRDSGRPSERKEPRILFLGNLEPRKGFRDLLMAMPAVLAIVPTAKLVFAGDGDIDGAQLLASKLDISASVVLLGFVRGERKARELQRAAVLCLPSYDEGVPMALLEGMSNAIPIVATPVGGVPDLICSGENGLLVSPGDVEGLARAIVSLLTNPHLSANIGNAGFAHVERFHGIDHVCALLDDIYLSLSRKYAPGRGHAIDASRPQDRKSF